MNRTCDKCHANIPHGNPYICVAHNIEYMHTDPITLQESISVVDAEEILVLCSNCGNRITRVAMKQMLNAIPVSQQTVVSN